MNTYIFAIINRDDDEASLTYTYANSEEEAISQILKEDYEDLGLAEDYASYEDYLEAEEEDFRNSIEEVLVIKGKVEFIAEPN